MYVLKHRSNIVHFSFQDLVTSIKKLYCDILYISSSVRLSIISVYVKNVIIKLKYVGFKEELMKGNASEKIY